MVDVGREFDFAIKIAVVDFHQVHPHTLAAGVVIRPGGQARRWFATTGELEALILNGHFDLRFFNARQINAHEVARIGFIQINIWRPRVAGDKAVIALVKRIELADLTGDVSKGRLGGEFDDHESGPFQTVKTVLCR